METSRSAPARTHTYRASRLLQPLRSASAQACCTSVLVTHLPDKWVGRAYERTCVRAGVRAYERTCVRAGVRACEITCVRDHERARVRASERASVRACERACVRANMKEQGTYECQARTPIDRVRWPGGRQSQLGIRHPAGQAVRPLLSLHRPGRRLRQVLVAKEQ